MLTKTHLLRYLQRKAQAVLQPLHDGQSSLRDESLRHLDEVISKADANAEALRHLTVSTLFNRWLTAPHALASRNEVGYWLNWLGLVGEGVEVGVFKGQFSHHLLNTWEGQRLTSVDPWKEFPTSEYIDVCNLAQEAQERNYQETLTRLEPFGGRSRALRMTSASGSHEFTNGTLDFVYLDAQHHYEAVREDIRAWSSKLKTGGVLGGHDYLDGVISSGVYGVKQAVDELAAALRVEVIVTTEPIYKSWFIRVP